METLKELHLIHSWLGLFHTLTAVLAMIFGTLVLFKIKGTKTHKILGYAYVINMLLLNGSAFGIYNFGTFSMFHFFAIVSLLSVLMGFYPVFARIKNWYRKHFYFMNWSVVGLYCAFWAEIGVRFFDMKYFWWVVMLATMFTSYIGARLINKQAKALNLN